MLKLACVISDLRVTHRVCHFSMEGKLDYFYSKRSLSSKNLQRSDFTEENLTCFIYIALLYINRLFQGFLKQDFEPNHNRNTSKASAMAETTSNHFGANECSFILIGLYGIPISPRAIWRHFARTSHHVCYVKDPICQLTACASSFRYKPRCSLKLPQTHPKIWYEMLVSDESIPFS